MISLSLVVGRISSLVELPPNPFQLDGRSLSDIYKVSSKNDISLKINNTRISDEIKPGLHEVESLDLHQAIELLTGNPPNATKVNRIGLVFAGKFKPKPSIFGVMFDWGRSSAVDGRQDTSPFQGVPREGCAVFIDRIRELRDDGGEFESQVAFTVIHELGHIFNLQHDNTPSFMSSSKANRSFTAADGVFQFDVRDQDFLSHCSESPHVWPGGHDFKDRGTLFASADSPDVKDSDRFGLTMNIDIQPREFWYFEPVELDIEIAVQRGVERTFRIPDTVDPGYDTFDIWIREPSGEIKRFRSPRQYCWPGSQCVVRKGKPFRRDISLFVESSGYTFTKAGHHEIWTTFRVSKNRFLKSNSVPIFIRPAEPSNVHYQQSYTMLTTPSHAKLLYYRRPSKSRQELNRLREFCAVCQSPALAKSVLYALGRAETSALFTTKSRRRVKELAIRAHRHLNEVSQSILVTPHRREKADNILKETVSEFM